MMVRLALSTLLQSKVMKFAMVGSMGFLADAAIFFLCRYALGSPLLVARTIAFLCAATLTWWGNRCFTFARTQRWGRFAQWKRAISGAIASAIPNFGVFQLTLMLIGNQAPQTMIALIFGVLAGMVSNFWLSNRWVFR